MYALRVQLDEPGRRTVIDTQYRRLERDANFILINRKRNQILDIVRPVEEEQRQKLS